MTHLSPWIWRSVLGTGLLIAVSFSCTRAQQHQSLSPLPQAPPVIEPARQVSAVDPIAPSPSDPPSIGGESYADAIRRRDFERAALLIDGSSKEERRSPEVRYARALVALELSDVETALRQIAGLDKEYPLFTAEVQAVKDEAARRSRDISLLGTLVPADDVNHQLLIAEAYEKNANLIAASRVADQIISKLAKSSDQTDLVLAAQARAIKARSLESEGKLQAAAIELRWLAIHAPHLSHESLGFNKSPLEKMGELAPTVSLSRSDRISRAEAFSKQGRVGETERELEALAQSGVPFPQGHGLLAWALYTSRTDYDRAAELFKKAAHAQPDKRLEYLYYEAKSLARSHRDNEAIGKYDFLAKQPGMYSDHARYQAARLRMIDGRFKEAASGLQQYLKTFGARAKHRNEARYSLAVAHLASGAAQQAILELQQLTSSAQGERHQAQLLELLGVGQLAGGRSEEARATFERVIELQPLSLAALFAGARLKQLGAPVPPWIPPAPSAVQSPIASPLALDLPEKAWRLNRVGLDLQAEAAVKTEETSLRERFGTRAGEGLCNTYGLLQSAHRRFQVAHSSISWQALQFEPSATTQWQWNCFYPSPYEDLVASEGTRLKIPASFVYGIMRQESAFRPSVVSPAKAVGLMQIIPPTAARIAEELHVPYHADLMNSPATNIKFGSYYLRRLLDMFAGRYEIAAAAYNAGPKAVSRWLRVGQDLPLDIFVATIPYEETRNYVYQVMGNYARYALLNPEEEIPQLDLDIPKGLTAPDDAY